MLRVVRALCAHDDALAAGLGTARAARAAPPAGQSRNCPARSWCTPRPAPSSRPWTRCASASSMAATPAWQEGYGHARAWQQQHGHLNIPVACISDGGFRLGSWLSSQRRQRNSGQLAADRIAALDGLGMIWDVLEETWMRAYHEARAWQEQHGHLEVPADVRTADGTGLAAWLTSQRSAWRQRHARGQPDRAAGADRVPPDAGRARWMRRYRQLTDAIDPAAAGSATFLPGPPRPPGWRTSAPRTAPASSRRTRPPCWRTPASCSAAPTCGTPPTRRWPNSTPPTDIPGFPRDPHPGRDRPGRLGYLPARPKAKAHQRAGPAARPDRVSVERPPGRLARPLPGGGRLPRPARPPQRHFPHAPGRMAVPAAQETRRWPAIPEQEGLLRDIGALSDPADGT